jgi:hypothetical protein
MSMATSSRSPPQLPYTSRKAALIGCHICSTLLTFSSPTTPRIDKDGAHKLPCMHSFPHVPNPHHPTHRYGRRPQFADYAIPSSHCPLVLTYTLIREVPTGYRSYNPFLPLPTPRTSIKVAPIRWHFRSPSLLFPSTTSLLGHRRLFSVLVLRSSLSNPTILHVDLTIPRSDLVFAHHSTPVLPPAVGGRTTIVVSSNPSCSY